MEIFKSKTSKMDNLKIISEFIDLVHFYHLKNALLNNNCRFSNRITGIYFILPEQQQVGGGCGSFSL